ncbi:hypothetical protein HD553DRAFT_308368 [Filobasidium floriforme]|uniref:uncharacterized protein n=1 Tax=Filobasidium floriforme TaxID=5210 RepID=UPI001E8E2FF5|nr:uncharacterized protein HD553DRAFT_308368 [Filobasidium floriforme]KAH8087525.1 hypothetical protein HD553DRAFT_308368 [Filobasidium floriforme]
MPFAALAKMGFNPKLAVVDNRFSNPRDLAANERNFLTSIRMICGLLAVTAALLLKFRFTNQSVDALRLDISGSGSSESGNNNLLARTFDQAGTIDQNAYAWASILGYLPPDHPTTPTPSNSTPEPIDTTPLLETNRISTPLGSIVFAICVFILISSTYGYSHTHKQLARGQAFAGSWKLEGSMTIVLAALLFAASVTFLTIGRISA